MDPEAGPRSDSSTAAGRRVLAPLHGARERLGSGLAIAVLLSPFLLGVLGWLAVEVVGREADGLDVAILSGMRDAGPPWLDDLAFEVTNLGSNPVLLALAFAVAAAFWIGRHRGYAIVLLVSAAGSILLNQFLKHAFARARPELLDVGVHVTSPLGFPSSHATVAMATYLVLAWLLAREMRRPLARTAAFGLAGLAIAAIGASRVYLGVHYPSDILAGWCLGFVWATACLAGGRLLGGFAPEGQGCRANTRVAPFRSKSRTS